MCVCKVHSNGVHVCVQGNSNGVHVCVCSCVHTCSACLVSLQVWLGVHTCARVSTRSPDVYKGVSREMPRDTQGLIKAWAGSLLTPGQKSESARLGLRKKRC